MVVLMTWGIRHLGAWQFPGKGLQYGECFQVRFSGLLFANHRSIDWASSSNLFWLIENIAYSYIDSVCLTQQASFCFLFFLHNIFIHFIHLQEWWCKIFMHFHKLLCPFLISHIILIITEIYKTIKIYISDISTSLVFSMDGWFIHISTI